MLALSTMRAAVFDVPHLFRVAARQHLGHQVVVVGRLVARMGALKRLPMVSKDLLENIPVPRGGCYHRIAPSWGDQLVAVPRLYHASAVSSTPHRPVYAHPHPLLSSETGATEIRKMNFPIRCTYVQYSQASFPSPSSPRCYPEGTRMAPAVATYAPRDPSRTVLYHVIADHLETFLASLDADPAATGLPAYVEREFYDYLQCGILAHGFLRLGCDTCPKELLLPFSCKRRGFCPSCAARRMAQTAAHLVECVLPWVPTRQWVVSVPIPLRYWMAASQDLTAQVHTIIRTTIGQYYVNQVRRESGM